VILDILGDHRVKLDHAHKYNGVEYLYNKGKLSLDHVANYLLTLQG